eukprot:SAG11_NODE_2878_length_2878_cov_2.849226_2_plen_119_part_00
MSCEGVIEIKGGGERDREGKSPNAVHLVDRYPHTFLMRMLAVVGLMWTRDHHATWRAEWEEKWAGEARTMAKAGEFLAIHHDIDHLGLRYQLHTRHRCRVHQLHGATAVHGLIGSKDD